VKSIALLGSTGSVGTQTLQVAERFPDRLEVAGLAAGRNVDLLIQQAKQFRPRIVSVARHEDVARVREALADPRVEVSSDCGEVAACGADLVVGALVGGVGLAPVLAALRAGSDVALANKEALVMAGELLLREARAHGARLIPLDSEHVAIHQCLAGQPRSALVKVTLTASGGPFRTASAEEIAVARAPEALAHPNWEMGPKITVDSATLMNKGFEVIEARWLFDLEPERIEVVIHPESVIHSLVEFCDGSWLAQLAVPDMRVPIAYALALPERLPLADLEPLDLVQLAALHFEAPDLLRFPALRLAREALVAGGTAPAILSAVNEVAVQAFLEDRIGFTAIPAAAEAVLEAQPRAGGLEIGEIFDADRSAREAARRWIEEHSK
jgi:1-deoxy-D-xylulose-5-phosphate reductoisomerase